MKKTILSALAAAAICATSAQAETKKEAEQRCEAKGTKAYPAQGGKWACHAVLEPKKLPSYSEVSRPVLKRRINYVQQYIAFNEGIKGKDNGYLVGSIEMEARGTEDKVFVGTFQRGEQTVCFLVDLNMDVESVRQNLGINHTGFVK